MDVLLVTDEDDFESALPALKFFAGRLSRAPLARHADGRLCAADVAIIDARSDPAAARDVCRRLTADAPTTAAVAIVAPADFAGIDADRHFDDVMPPAAEGDELQVRLRLAIARRRSALQGSLKFGGLVLHPASCTGSLDGADLHLTLTEFRLLIFLVQHAGHAFTRTRLLHEVWGYDSTGRVRTVDVHVRRLRAKLGAEHASMIDTVRGVGYMAATPPQPRWIVDDTASARLPSPPPAPDADCG